MTATERLIQDAVKGGWIELQAPIEWWDKPWGPQKGRSTPRKDLIKDIAKGNTKEGSIGDILLNPTAWKAVGKVRGWDREMYCAVCSNGIGRDSDEPFLPQWKYYTLGLTDALCDGKTIEQYLLSIETTV